MKHLKSFENADNIKDDLLYKNIDNIEIGDYLYCEIDPGEYIPNNFVAKLIEIVPNREVYPYRVQYQNEDKPRLIMKSEIKDHSKNMKDLEHYISADKYNL